MFINNNLSLNKEVLFLVFLYLSLIISFLIGENSTGGAILDYENQKLVSLNFASNFNETLLNYDNFRTRHSPVLIIFLSIFEILNLDDYTIRLIHLHFGLFLPYFFFKVLKIKFKNIENKYLILLTGLVFLSPTFRSLCIWPDSRILGLTFFTISVYYFFKFKENENFNYAIINIITCALSAYISPNFSVFSLFFFYNYLKYFNFLSKKIFLISIINLVLALPAFYYVFILDINFLNKTAAINIDEQEKIFFHNIFNDLLITFSIIFFYLFPFLIEKIIKLPNLINKSNILISLILFFLCVYFFNYNYEYSGGGIYFKISNFLFNNNIFFFIISFVSIFVFTPFLINSKENLFLFILIIINNPQYTIYHKYFDPFLIILFFSLFNFEISLKHKGLKNLFFTYIYFLIFLIISNFKLIWTT